MTFAMLNRDCLKIGSSGLDCAKKIARKCGRAAALVGVIFICGGILAAPAHAMCARHVLPDGGDSSGDGQGDPHRSRYVSIETLQIRQQLRDVFAGKLLPSQFKMPGDENARIGYWWENKTLRERKVFPGKFGSLQVADGQVKLKIDRAPETLYLFLLRIEPHISLELNDAREIDHVFYYRHATPNEIRALTSTLTEARDTGQTIRFARKLEQDYLIGTISRVSNTGPDDWYVDLVDGQGKGIGVKIENIVPESIEIVDIKQRALTHAEQVFLDQFQAAARAEKPIAIKVKESLGVKEYEYRAGIPWAVVVQADGEPSIQLSDENLIRLNEIILDSLVVDPKMESVKTQQATSKTPFDVKIYRDSKLFFDSKKGSDNFDLSEFLRVLDVLADQSAIAGAAIPEVISNIVNPGQTTTIYLTLNGTRARITFIRDQMNLGWGIATRLNPEKDLGEKTEFDGFEKMELEDLTFSDAKFLYEVRKALANVSVDFAINEARKAHDYQVSEFWQRLGKSGPESYVTYLSSYFLIFQRLKFSFETGLVGDPSGFEDLPIESKKFFSAMGYLITNHKKFDGSKIVDFSGQNSPAGASGQKPNKWTPIVISLVKAMEDSGLIFENGTWKARQ